jgi:hypothetical protein
VVDARESSVYVRFADGASCHTQNLASTSWVIYSPTNQLVSSRGVCLREPTNNVASIVLLLNFCEMLCHMAFNALRFIYILSWLCHS